CSRRTIGDFTIEKSRPAHKTPHRANRDESGLVGAQIRPLTFDRLHRAGKAGGVSRRCCRSFGAATGLRARVAIDHETPWVGGELLWSCRERTFACPTRARSAQRRRPKKVSASRRPNFRACAPI